MGFPHPRGGSKGGRVPRLLADWGGVGWREELVDLFINPAMDVLVVLWGSPTLGGFQGGRGQRSIAQRSLVREGVGFWLFASRLHKTIKNEKKGRSKNQKINFYEHESSKTKSRLKKGGWKSTFIFFEKMKVVVQPPFFVSDFWFWSSRVRKSWFFDFSSDLYFHLWWFYVSEKHLFVIRPR